MDDAHEFGSGLRKHLGFGFEHEPLPAHETADDSTSPPTLQQPDPREAELAERLAYLAAAEAALVERERQVREREGDVEAREAELTESSVRAHGDVRQVLRRRAEQQADAVWHAFDEALRATTRDGAPDHPVRIAAARALLAEAYSGAGATALEDELAQLRARRSAFGS